MIERKYLGSPKALLKVLPDLFPEVSYSEIRACLRRRDVKANGVRVSAGDFLIISGSTLTIYPKTQKQVVVLYEDDNLLACRKPKGIASEGEGSFETLVRGLYPEARLLHRLDTNTDGVILFSRTEVASRELFDGMKNGLIEKEYLAEVYGHPNAGGEVVLDYYYHKDAEKGRATISDRPQAGFVPVRISFSVLERKEESTVLLVKLHKGKTHQIRAMLAHYGFFILGDGKYGSDEVNRRLGVKKTLLTACAVRFFFPPSAFLSYLNDITISL